MKKKRLQNYQNLLSLLFLPFQKLISDHGHLRKPPPQQPKRLQKQKTSQTKENHPKETSDHSKRFEWNQNLLQQNPTLLPKHLTRSLLPKSDQNH